jgi:signal peptidase I
MIEKKKIVGEIRSWIFSILLAFFVVALLNTKVFAKVQVQQSSMENTLFSQQQLIIDKASYYFVEPKRGDIIIFLENEERGTIVQDVIMFIDDIRSTFEGIDRHTRLVKRVIGIPGDKVDIKNGYVYVNGKKLDEPYVKGETLSQEFQLPITVGANKLFVLGDNRPVSKDSREFGLIDYDQVEGKAIFRVFPFDKIGYIN